MTRAALAGVLLIVSTAAEAREPAGLHSALQQLVREGKFGGAVVIRDLSGTRFARGYGLADPFTGRRFTPDTPVDSGSLAKPMTAAAVLMLARDGRLDLDAPVRRYLPEFPHPTTIVRHLLDHSAGLPFDNSAESLAGKNNAALLSSAGSEPAFPPGTAFAYCNLCYTALALLIERVSGLSYLDFLRNRIALPAGTAIRPARLAHWSGRAVGYRRGTDGKLERFDSWEGELFYGSGNLSISAAQLARWGAEWWQPRLQPIQPLAATTALIGGRPSGLTLGNWYCAPRRRRCHYLGHHEGFHHMLYWDADRRVSVAMVTNNALAPALQQRLQRALVAFAMNRASDARSELARPLDDVPVTPGRYALPDGDTIAIGSDANAVHVTRRGLRYRAFPVGRGIHYVPGLDAYLAGGAGGRLHWLGLYEDWLGATSNRR